MLASLASHHEGCVNGVWIREERSGVRSAERAEHRRDASPDHTVVPLAVASIATWLDPATTSTTRWQRNSRSRTAGVPSARCRGSPPEPGGPADRSKSTLLSRWVPGSRQRRSPPPHRPPERPQSPQRGPAAAPLIRLMADASNPSTKSLSVAVPSAERYSSGSFPPSLLSCLPCRPPPIGRRDHAAEASRVGGGLFSPYADAGFPPSLLESKAIPLADRKSLPRALRELRRRQPFRWRACGGTAICPLVTGSSGQKKRSVGGTPW